MTLKADGFDMNNYAARMQISNYQTVTGAQQLVRSGGYALVTWGQRFAPVDTGNLRNGIGVDFDLRAGAGYYQATAGPTARYAPYVEDGTRHMAPRAFMGPAMDRVGPGFHLAASALGADPIDGPGGGARGSF